MEQNKIIIYQTEDGQTQIDVRMENETVWLSTGQMAILFDREESNIRRHIINVFKEGELKKENNVHFLHVNGVKKPVPFYNLDVIISVGYRVKSLRGVQFRQWANQVLKQYLFKGYAVNQRIHSEQIAELRQLVQMAGRTIQNQQIVPNDENGRSNESHHACMNGRVTSAIDEVNQTLFDIVVDYTYALDTLDDYDYQRLRVAETTQEDKLHDTYENAMEAIKALRDKFGGSSLFGNETDDSFKSSIGQIYQTFGGEELYPSVEEKAAMLLYLVTKNHSFSDGNKRIAATLFLWFLNNNGILYRPDGTKRLADNTLVALTLMIAEPMHEQEQSQTCLNYAA